MNDDKLQVSLVKGNERYIIRFPLEQWINAVLYLNEAALDPKNKLDLLDVVCLSRQIGIVVRKKIYGK